MLPRSHAGCAPMVSVPSSSPRSQQAVLFLSLPLQLHPRYHLRRLPLPSLGLSVCARRGARFLLPAPWAVEGNDGHAVTKEDGAGELLPAPWAAEEKDGHAVTKEDGEEEDARREDEEEEEKGGAGGGRDGEGAERGSGRFTADYIPLGIREPVYEVIEVKSNGRVSTKKISRRQLLKSSGLRLRDTRSVDPSLWLMNSMPSLLIRESVNPRILALETIKYKKIKVREQAILINLGSLRAIAMHERVLIFNYNSPGGKAFLELLLPRLNPRNINGGPAMSFQLEVVEAALLSRIQRLERRLMHVQPRVTALLEVLPNRLTADVLEQLRLSKQSLVELGSRAGDLKQMLIDLLEDPHEIRRICIMGRNCTVDRLSDDMECSVPLEKQVAEEEEEEIEMLLENYLQRCESCHGQAERLLDSAREMEDSIAVNLSSRRLEVSRVELLLQVGTFFIAVGALVAGIFGMNLQSYLETNTWAFWATTGGIVAGAVAGFFLVYSYLKARKIL